MAIFFSPAPTPEDLRDFRDDDDSLTPTELEEVWRSIPEPTPEQFQPPLIPYDTWQGILDHGDKGGAVTFYRRKWKKDRKADAIAQRAEAKPQPEPDAGWESDKNIETACQEQIDRDRRVADEAFRQASEGMLQNAKAKGVNLRELAEKVAKAAEDSKPDTSRLDEHLGKMQEQLREFGKRTLESSERARSEDKWRRLYRQMGFVPLGDDLAEDDPEFAEWLERQQENSRRNPRPVEKPQSVHSNHSEWFWGGTAVLITILALVFWGLLFVAAWGFYFVWIYRAPWFGHATKTRRQIFKGVIDSAIALALFFLWLYVPSPFKPNTIEPQVKTNASSERPSVTVAESQPSALGQSEVKPEYLVGLYQKYNSAQADQVVKTYIGQPLKASGVVNDVKRDGDGVSVLLFVKRMDGWTLYAISARFDEQRWEDRAVVFDKGEKVTVAGKILGVSETSILLEHCEIIE